jgi:hypothetical protein
MTRAKVPQPISGGLLLSYKCSAECRHCMYACSPKWEGDWIAKEDLEEVLSQLARRIRPSPLKNSLPKNSMSILGEDYEAHGRAFYRLAAEHEKAKVKELDDVPAALSENFILAEKPLAFLAGRYLRFTKHRLFEL